MSFDYKAAMPAINEARKQAAIEYRAERERRGAANRRPHSAEVRSMDTGARLDGQPEAKFRLRLIPFDEIKLGTESRYLVKGIIPRFGLVIVWGPPKCGKSFWMFDVAMHVALGWQYRDRRVQQGAAVYCAFEGQKGLEARTVKPM